VRRLGTWLAGAAGGLAAYRALTRRRLPASELDDPVDELREKLAHARETEQGAAPPADDPDARRRAVHEQGRAAIDDMRSGDPT
jgi:hypothetical protein